MYGSDYLGTVDKSSLSKRIGNLGEIKVISKFIEYDIPVYIPFGDCEKADLIAEFNGKLNKIQVKTSIEAKNGKMKFNLSSCTFHRKNGVRHIYNKNEIDYFACYNIERDKVFLLPIEFAPATSITIRFEQPKNNQLKNVIMEDKFLIDNMLNK